MSRGSVCTPYYHQTLLPAGEVGRERQEINPEKIRERE
jgi:hypothetical protein